MKDMNCVKVTVIGIIAAWAVSFMGVAKVQAQEFKVQGDLVSSYVWRGFYQTGVSFQPTLGFGMCCDLSFRSGGGYNCPCRYSQNVFG